MGITILPPDMNRGMYGFSVDHGADPLWTCCDQERGASGHRDALVEEREKNGTYRIAARISLNEIVTGIVNKRAIENFIKAGALDCLAGNQQTVHERL